MVLKYGHSNRKRFFFIFQDFLFVLYRTCAIIANDTSLKEEIDLGGHILCKKTKEGSLL